MLEMSCTRAISATPAKVFEVVSDLPNAPGRVKAITKMEILTPGPIGKGTRFRETRTMFGRDATEEMEITAFDPPRGFTIECTNHGCHYVSEFRITPEESGSELAIHFRARPLNIFTKWLGLLMKPLAKKLVASCSKDLDDIARAAEGRSS